MKGDKSLSHRLLMITSLITAKSVLKNISACRDVSTTISCLKKCNIDIVYQDNRISIAGGTLQSPEAVLDCENSGSTLRMLIGLLSGKHLSASFDGDKSLKSRPMNRIINPLENMGVSIISNNGKLPIHIKTKDIKAINYSEKTKSAQVKTALIFAGLGSNKGSNISYNKFTRDHTEQIMNDIANDSKYICKTPEPRVRFRKFCESGLLLQLLAWIEKPEIRGLAIDELSTEIYNRFNKSGISFPFPQRTIHIKKTDL